MNQKKLIKTGRRIFVAAAMVFSILSTGISSYAKTTDTAVKVTTQGTYKDKDGNYEAVIKTPKVTGKVKGLKELNSQMLTYTKSIKSTYLSDKKAAPEGRELLDTSYKTMSNTDTTLSIGINTVIVMGGSNSFSKYFTLDKKTGKVLTLKDLFKKDADYVTLISKNIIGQMKKNMEKDEDLTYFIKAESAGEGIADEFYFTKIGADQSFYIDNKGNLVIAFNKYDVAPGYMGVVSFVIPKAAISSILK